MPKPISSDFITLRGRAAYARVLGEPMDNFDKDGKEFKLDFILDDNKDLARLKKLGVGDRVKQKEDYLDGQPHMTVRQKTEKVKDETTNTMVWKNRPKVEDIFGEAWPQATLLGNDTVIDLKLRVADYGKGFKKGIYISGIRVLELVPYVKNAFEEIDKDDPYYQKANAARIQNSAAGNDEQEDDSGDADDEQVETNADPDDDNDDEAV